MKRVLERCGWKDPSLGPWEWKGHSEALCGGLKKWTPNLLVYGVGPALWLCHHYNTSSMQFSHYKIRKTAFFVVKGCLHYFCPIKYLLVRAFLVLCLVGLGFSFPAISFSLHWNPVPQFSSPVWQCHRVPRCTQTPQEYPRQTQLSGWSPILRKTQALLPGLLFLSSKIIILFSSAAAALSLEVISAKASSKLIELGTTAELPAQGDQSPRSSVWPSLQSLWCDFTHSFLLEKSVKSHRLTIKPRNSVRTINALPLKNNT